MLGRRDLHGERHVGRPERDGDGDNDLHLLTEHDLDVDLEQLK